MNTLSRFFHSAVTHLFIVFCLTFASTVQARPDAPSGFKGTVDGNTVKLEWDRVEGVAGYNVYINNGYLTTTFDNEHVISVDNDGVNSFYVTAFTKNPTEFSRRSEQITLPDSEPPSDLTIPPSIPTGLRGNINGTSITLNWDASTDDEAVAGYNVYQDNAYLTTVFDTQFNGTVVAGQSYSYGIVAFDTRRNFSRTSQRLTLSEASLVNDSSISESSAPASPEPSTPAADTTDTVDAAEVVEEVAAEGVIPAVEDAP